MKITKLISLILSVCMIAMCLPLSFMASAESYTYEVGPGVGNSTSTSVATLVDTVIQPNTTASDEVTVNVTNQGTGDANTPYWFAWRNNSSTPHAATVTYTTKPGEEKAYLYSGDGAYFTLYGDSVFKNIRIYVTDLGRGVMTGGHNCTIENTTEVVNNGYSAYAKLYVGGLANQGVETATDDGITTVDGVNFDGYNGGATGAVILGSGYYSPTIPGNQTFISKNNSINLAFSGESQATYNQNLNVVLENSHVARSYPAWTANGSTVVQGAIQILANGNSIIDKDSLYNSATNSNITATGGVYLLDSSEYGGSLELTDTVGTYKVTHGGTAVATDGVNTYTSVNGYLTVPAGKYSVSYDYYSYYVTSGAGESAEHCVAKLVDTVIQPNHSSSDKVNIYVSNEGRGTSQTPIMFAWRNNSSTPHAATVTYTTKPGEEKANLYSGDGAFFTLYGDSVFKNIRIYVNGLGRGIMTGGHDCTIENTTEVVSDGYSAYAKLYVGGLANQGTAVATGDGVTTVDGVNFDGYNSGATGGVILGGYAYYSPTVPGNQTFVSKNNSIRLSFAGESLTTFKKNLNIVLENVSLQDTYTRWGIDGQTVVEGAIQILVNGNSEGNFDKAYSYASIDGVVNPIGGVYLLNTYNAEGTLGVTDTAGTYTATSNHNYVFAYDQTNQPEVVYIGTNTLTVNGPGKYKVGFVDDLDDVSNYIPGEWSDNGDGTMSRAFNCTGNTITAFTDCTIDLTKVSPTIESPNKVFIGWKVTSTGQYAVNPIQLTEGETLTAQYVETNETDFGIVRTEVRTVGNDGLRFVIGVNKTFYNSLPNVGEFGTISLPTDDSRGRDIYLDEAVIYDWSSDELDKNQFSAKTTGATPTKVVAENIFAEDDDSFEYTLTITGITQSNYDRYYLCRGYIKYVDNNGINRIAYTEHANTSLYHTAVDTVDSIDEEDAPTVKAKLDAIIDYVETTEKEAFMSATKYLKTGYDGCEDTDPNHALYIQNGIRVRDIVIDSGKNLESEVRVVAFSDPHLNSINRRDMEVGNANTLATYRARDWNKDGMSGIYMENCVKYAKYSNQTVVIGDIMDYLSYGCAEAAKKMLFDRFLPNKLIATLGNHEQIELMQINAETLSLHETLSMSEKDEMLSNYWPNDLYYTSRIVENADDQEGAMVIGMMNGWDVFYASQKTMLAADIATARQKGIPVLIFVHNPLCTRNPNESTYYLSYGAENFGSSTNYNEILDMENTCCGNPSSDQTTLDVYNLIAKNSDVIKGVFHAHVHGNMYTEIMAQDANGDFISDGNGGYVTIPQYGVHAIAATGGSLLNIVVK